MITAPPRRKLVFGIIFAFLVYCLTEAVSWIFYLIHEQDPFSFLEHQQARGAIVQENSQQKPPGGLIPLASIESEVIHPYLGFVIDPRENSGYSEYGFLGNTPLFHRQPGKDLVIGVFGGSFANSTVLFGAHEIQRRLRLDPRFADMDIIVQPIALGGYKQPQQLLALTYFLSLGAQFDVVVNLDGFNEVALAYAENAGIVNPFYPRGWAARTGNLVDPATLRLVGSIVTLDDQIANWARRFSGIPLRFNITANLIWRYHHVSLYQRRVELSEQLQHHRMENQGEFTYVMTGPTVDYESEDQMFRELAREWMEASLQMHYLCSENGIEYFHFLQPNQYVPGSKPLSRKELEMAFDEDQPYRHGVILGYPLLIELGELLRERGVNFIDLTGIFSDSAETLYSDTCCHVTADGYEIVGSAIADVIRNQELVFEGSLSK